jgi:hypothetical protein
MSTASGKVVAKRMPSGKRKAAAMDSPEEQGSRFNESHALANPAKTGQCGVCKCKASEAPAPNSDPISNSWMFDLMIYFNALLECIMHAAQQIYNDCDSDDHFKWSTPSIII